MEILKKEREEEAARNAHAIKEQQKVKYVQYVPNQMGNDTINLDKAIKNLYLPKYTNVS